MVAIERLAAFRKRGFHCIDECLHPVPLICEEYKRSCMLLKTTLKDSFYTNMTLALLVIIYTAWPTLR